MSGPIGFLIEPSSLTIDAAHAGLCSYLLAHQNAELPILLSDKTPALESLQWLGVSWREPAAPSKTQSFLDDLFLRGLLYECGCTSLSAPHSCLQKVPSKKICYRLQLSKIESLRYQDETHNELALLAEDPVVTDDQKRPGRAFEIALRALESEIQTLIVQPYNEAVATLLAAFRLLEAKTPLRMMRLPTLASDEFLTVEGLRSQGYLPHAIFNALYLLSWLPGWLTPTEGGAALSKEFLLLLYKPELAAARGTTSRSGSHASISSLARFDLVRLRSLNEAHIRALSFEELGEALRPFLQEKLWRDSHSLLQWAKLARDEISTLLDVEHLAYFVERALASPENAPDEVLAIMREESVSAVLASAVKYFTEGGTDFHALRTQIEAQTGAKRKRLFYPLRIALTGKLYGPSFPEVLPFLGAQECLARIAMWQEFLGNG
jgi:glutamyl/glutaminyl-tRNA synthetase